MTRDDIWREIGAERTAQSAKWGGIHSWGKGDCSSPDVASGAGDPSHLLRLVILSEEVGEVSRAILDDDPDNLRTELIQVAAVAVAWLESL